MSPLSPALNRAVAKGGSTISAHHLVLHASLSCAFLLDSWLPSPFPNLTHPEDSPSRAQALFDPIRAVSASRRSLLDREAVKRKSLAVCMPATPGCSNGGLNHLVPMIIILRSTLTISSLRCVFDGSKYSSLEEFQAHQCRRIDSQGAWQGNAPDSGVIP